ncbi:F0F1 ATP synthase subunit B family protein [Sphingomonas sp. ASY06-1R]|uniref:F0F1 ATP synthase subunit B family protein n=1 Tax=Sphingomonas sp. ASY06-1R TaxID=3445771 RepID=UPI003FA25F57
MPQIDQIASIYASQLFWLVVVFGLILIGSYLMLPKIQGTVEQRDARISGDLAAAERARAEADAADDAYQTKLGTSRSEAQVAAAKAKAEAAAISEKEIKSADAAIAAKVSAAEAQLQAQQAAALSEIENVAADAVQEIVAKVAGLRVDQQDAAAAVKTALAA